MFIGSLDGPDRLLLNDGSGKLKLVNEDESLLGDTYGTLGIALADLDKDCRLAAVQSASPPFYARILSPSSSTRSGSLGRRRSRDCLCGCERYSPRVKRQLDLELRAL